MSASVGIAASFSLAVLASPERARRHRNTAFTRLTDVSPRWLRRTAPAASSPLPRSCPAAAPGPTATAGAITTFMGTSSERLFNGSGKGYLPAGAIGNRSRILSERLKAGTESKRLKKGHRPAPMPQTWTHILSYKPPLVTEMEGSLSVTR